MRNTSLQQRRNPCSLLRPPVPFYQLIRSSLIINCALSLSCFTKAIPSTPRGLHIKSQQHHATIRERPTPCDQPSGQHNRRVRYTSNKGMIGSFWTVPNLLARLDLPRFHRKLTGAIAPPTNKIQRRASYRPVSLPIFSPEFSQFIRFTFVATLFRSKAMLSFLKHLTTAAMPRRKQPRNSRSRNARYFTGATANSGVKNSLKDLFESYRGRYSSHLSRVKANA